jgi:RalA-binding protein 1
VHRLPSANLTLLSALSQFLIEIVNNSDVNKMTVRNVGIVFAPTLNIPAPVFSMFLTDYDSIFGDLSSGPGPSVELTVDRTRTLSADDIRSPRHQMFSEIPTPSYNQTSFQGQSEPNSAVEPPRAQHQDTGFIPMQPTYDQNAYQQQMYNQQAGSSAGFTSLNGMLVPNNTDDTRSARSKRRESSMLFMENSTSSQSAGYPS